MHNINMQTPAQDVVHITYEDLETIEYQPQRLSDCPRTTVYFQLHRDDREGISISSALGNGCDDLIGARIPAPWGAHVHAKLALRIHVSIPLNVILSDTHQ